MAIPCLKDVISSSFNLPSLYNFRIWSMMVKGLSFPLLSIHDTKVVAKTQREKMNKFIFISN